MNYWYVARPNELFLDIDNPKRSLPHARARLQGAIECGKLDVAYVSQRPSRSGKLHVIITLQSPICIESESFAWEIILHGDIYRAACNLMRSVHKVESPDILISNFQDFQYPGTAFLRMADDSCDCKTKHNAATMQNCPAAIRLRGEHRNAGFFGKPSKNPCTIWPEMK